MAFVLSRQTRDEKELLAVASDPSKLRPLLIDAALDDHLRKFVEQFPTIVLAATQQNIEDPTKGDCSKLVTELLRNGSGSISDFVPFDGGTALMWAAYLNNAKCVTVLLDAGADIDLASTDGTTPLGWAAIAANFGIAQHLLDRGAKTDLADMSGRTALVKANDNQRRAVEVQKHKTTHLLVERGQFVMRSRGHPRARRQLHNRALVQSLVPNDGECMPVAYERLARTFQGGACAGLHDCVTLVAAAERYAARLRSSNIERAQGLVDVSTRLQLCAAALLETLDEQQIKSFLSRRPGRAALCAASISECKLLLARPGLQLALNRQWHGSLLYMVKTGVWESGFDAWTVTLEWYEYCLMLPLSVLVVLPFNLLLLPLVTAVPALGPWVSARLRLAGQLIPGEATGSTALALTPWEWIYLIDTPFFKFVVTTMTTLAFAATLTFWDPRGTGVVARRTRRQMRLVAGDEAEEHMEEQLEELPEVEQAEEPHDDVWVGLLLLWCAVALATELDELRRARRFWLVDVLNVVELSALSCCLVALLLWILDLWYMAAAARASGCALLFASQGFRLLSLSPSLGPLTLMLFKMINDVLLWLCLLGVVAVSAASAFIVLAEILDCDLAASGGVELSFGSELQRLFYVALEYEDEGGFGRSCWEGSLLANIATVATVSYLMLAVILLLNMLIAMMAKTFDNVWDAQDSMVKVAVLVAP